MEENIAGQLFSGERLTRHGDSIAVQCDGRTLTYRQFAELSRESGEFLRDHGAAAGDRVIVSSDEDTETFAALILGAMGAGMVPVIVSSRLSGDDIDYVAEETRAVVHAESRPGRREPQARNLAPASSGDSAGALSNEAFWLYSSGTTGRMKGVVHGHHDLSAVMSFHADTLGIAPGVKTFCTSRLSFAYAMGNGFLGPLALGATMVLHPAWPTPGATLETIGETRPDVVFSVPSMYRGWLEAGADGVEAMASVTRFVSAGEHLPLPVAERWHRLTDATILDCYGCSETIFLVFAPAGQVPPDSVGGPCANVETKLLDEDGNEARPGETGSLFIRHPFLALSYGPAAPADAQARFDGGWFATGDKFRRDAAGHWYHDGREDDWLKVAGQWVSLRGVEDIAAGFNGVSAAAGVSATDADGFLRIALFVVPGRDSKVETLEYDLQGFLQSELPTFRRPKWIRVIDDLPQTSTGKIRKVELRRIIEQSL